MEDHEIYTAGWLAENVLSVGPLGDIYDREMMEEGDSPAFFHVMNTGMRSTESPSWGGWGGRFAKHGPGNFWTDARDDGRQYKTALAVYCTDFGRLCREDAVVGNSASYEEANHGPVVLLNHDEDLMVNAGRQVTLDASPTWDPDGDELEFNWWVYNEAGSWDGEVTISGHNTPVQQVVHSLRSRR
jgi:hypothetical protein